MPSRVGIIKPIVVSYLSKENIKINQKRINKINDKWLKLPTPQVNLTLFRILELLGQPKEGDPDWEEYEGFPVFQSYSVICLEFRGSLFGFTYDDDGCFILYENEYKKNSANYLRIVLYNTIRDCKFSLSDKLKERMETKDVAIKNEFNDDLSGIYWLEEEISKQYSSYLCNSAYEVTGENRENIDENDFMSPSEAEYAFLMEGPYELEEGKRPSKFKISIYIQAVFSFIEHCSMCLLPLWESANTRQWETIKEKANKYFDPQKWTTFLMHKDDRVQEFMELVEDVFFEEDKDLGFEYRNAKSDLRNVSVHGHLTSRQLENLTFCIPSLRKEFERDTETSLNEISFFSFIRVKHLLEKYLSYIRSINPIHFAILASGLDIPGDCSELLQFVGSDETRVYQFIKKWKAKRLENDNWEC